MGKDMDARAGTLDCGLKLSAISRQLSAKPGRCSPTVGLRRLPFSGEALQTYSFKLTADS
jgi:hypothetical protein